MVSTLNQRHDALRAAQNVRTATSAVRREVSSGELPIREAIADPRARRLTAFDLVGSVPWYGPARASRLLRLAGVPELKRVGDLTERQRQAITDRIGGRA